MVVEKITNIRDHERKSRDADAVDRDPVEREAIIVKFPPTRDHMRPRALKMAQDSMFAFGFVAFLFFAAIEAAFAQGAGIDLGAARGSPRGFCQATLSAATALSGFTCASFTGTGSGTVLTASSVSGQIHSGQGVAGTGVPANTTIVSQVLPLGAGEVAGGAGRYNTSAATTSSGASLTTNGAPQTADFAEICASVAGVNWRDDGTAPTASIGSGGMPLTPVSATVSTCMSYSGNFSKLQFINITGSPIVSISFYKSGAL